MARVVIRHGNMFDRPTDLIVFPVSTGGTVTGFVAGHLHDYNLPHPKDRYAHGEVTVAPLIGLESVAQYVAFAASVRGVSSNLNVIEGIGRSLGEATQRPGLTEVSAPLLGAGAGGLRSADVVKALRAGFLATAKDGASLSIFVLHQTVYDSLIRTHQEAPGRQFLADGSHRDTEAATNVSPPRVFISYSGTDRSHKDWVATLATFLRENGIEARLDQWHLRVGADLPQWMANEIQMADRIVIVSDSRYADRANGRVGGVGWETMLIQGELMREDPLHSRFLVIIREEEYSRGTPYFLQTRFGIHWPAAADERENRVKLLAAIRDEDRAPPMVG